MATLTKETLFGATKVAARDKAEHTTNIARGIVSAETNAREAKTERLRIARMAQEAVDQTAADAAPAPVKAKKPAKPRKAAAKK